MSKTTAFELYQKIQPYVIDDIANTSSATTAASGLTAHAINGPFHTGTLDRSQAPWVATDITEAIGDHAALTDAHHARLHDIASSGDHAITGSVLDVVGATATDTIGIITPSSAPGSAEAILKSDSSGFLTLPKFVATTNITTPLIDTASGDLTLDPAGASDVIIAGSRPTQFDTSAGDIIVTGNAAGWAFGLKAKGSGGTDHGGFGFHGSSDALTKYWIGPSFSSPYVSIDSTGVGIGNTSPSYALDVTGTAYASTQVLTPIVGTSTGDLTLSPADDLMIGPVSNLAKITSGVSLQADNYASQVTGWRVTHDGQADFRYLFVDEMHAKSFIADLEQALAGGQIITKSVAELYSDFTAPAAGGSTTLTMRDLPSATGMAVFVDGDYIRIREFSRSGGSLSISDCWGTVVLDTSYGTSGFDSSTKTQRYTFTRSTGADAGTMSASNVVEADAIILDYGTSGNGFYEVNAIDGLYGANSPYAQIVTWTTHPRNQTIRARLGNLYGIWSVSGEYGLYAGDGITDDDSYLRISSNTVRLNNVPLQLYSSGTQKVNIDSTGTDVWFGVNSGDKRLSWNGTTLSVEGTIVVTGGSGIDQFADAGVLATADDLDGVPDGSTYGRIDQTIIAGGLIQVGSGTKDSNLSGWHISGTEIVGQSSGADQVILNTSGQISAGAGNVLMDALGIDLQQDDATTPDAARAISWWPSIGTRTGTPTQSIQAFFNNLNQNLLVMEAQPAGGVYTVSRVDLIAGSETVTLYSDGSLVISPETTINDTLNTEHVLPKADDTYDSGSASKRWRTVYADQIVATSISGTTMSGQEWEYAGSMVIDANDSGNTTLQVVNQGAGSVSMTVNGGTVWHSGNDGAASGLDADTLDGVQGSGYSLATHNHDGVYALLGHNHDSDYVPLARTVTAGSGLTGGGALSTNITLNHEDTSSVANESNSGTTFLQSMTFDGFGHVLTVTAADAATALDSRYLKLDGTSTGATSQIQLFTTGVDTTGSYYIDGGRFIDNYGVNNLFVGSESGNQTLTSQQTVALGKRTGTVLTSGNDNVLIGFQTGYAMTTGYSNTFIGSRAGESNVDGNNNLYLGQAAGRYATGSENVGIGGAALGSMTSGIENVGIGFTAGGNSTQGNYNVFIGVRSGRYATATASNNVLIGRRAGWNLSGNGNVFIGFQAGYNETGSNKLYIENTNSSAPLIYGDFSTDEVLINGDLEVDENLDVTGITTITGGLLVAADTDGDAVLHRAIVGDGAGSDTATFSHYDYSSAYALAQFATGATRVNTASGQQIELAIADTATFSVDTDSLLPRSSNEVDAGDYNRKLRTIYASELYVENLVAQDVIATIGGRILVTPTTKLIADVDSLDTTIDIEHNNLAANDYVYLAAVHNGIPVVEVMKVTSAATTIAGGYRYDVDRGEDGLAHDWYIGDAVASYAGGAAGEGFIDLTATSTTQSHLGPTITHYVRTATTNWNDVKPVVSSGNLRSWVDYSSDEFGFAAGNDLTLTSTGGFRGVTIDRTNGIQLYGTTLKAYDGLSQTVDLDNLGNLGLGSDLAASSTTSFYFNSSTGSLRVGSLGTNLPNLYFDGSDLHLRSNTTNVITLANDGSSYFAGAMTIGTSGGIYQGSGTLASPTTGLKIWNDSGTGRIGGYNAGTIQWYADTDGKLYAGGGDVLLDADGLTIEAGTGESNQLAVYSGATKLFQQYTYLNGAGYADTTLKAIGTTNATLRLEAEDTGDTAQLWLQPGSINFYGGVVNINEFGLYVNDGITIASGDLDLDGNDITDIGQIGESWTGVSYATGWADYGGSYEAVEYKAVGDLVIMRGLAKRTSGTVTQFATLPVGYRPPARLIFTTYTSTGVGELHIASDGVVELISGGTGWVTLSPIVFSTI